VSIQFFCGFPGFLFVLLIFQCTACLGSLLLSIRRTCPSHLSLRSFTMRFIFSSCVCALTLSLLTLPFHVIPITYGTFGTCSVQLLAFYFVQLSVVLICLFFQTDFTLPNMLLALRILVWQSLRSYCHLSHSCPDNRIPRSSQLQHFSFRFPCCQPSHY